MGLALRLLVTTVHRLAHRASAPSPPRLFHARMLAAAAAALRRSAVRLGGRSHASLAAALPVRISGALDGDVRLHTLRCMHNEAPSRTHAKPISAADDNSRAESPSESEAQVKDRTREHDEADTRDSTADSFSAASDSPSLPSPPPAAPSSEFDDPPSTDLDRSIRRALFLNKSRMRARGALDRMHKWRTIMLGTRRANGPHHAAEAAVSQSAGAPASPLPPSHPSASVAQHHELSIEEAVKRVFHRSLVSRLGDRLGRLRSRVVLQRWRRIMAHLLQMGGSSTGNTVKLFNDGTQAYAAMWSAIAAAKHSIHMESYIVEPDGVGLKTIRLLTEAAQRGVEVKFCYDSWGSSNLIRTRSCIDQLEAAGAKVVHFNPIWHLFLREAWRGSLWFRNHRKILIVDSRVAFCGGMNLATDGSEFVGGTGKFRDTHLQLEGPAVAHLEMVSRDTFQEALHVLPPNWADQAAREAERDRRISQRRDKPRWYPQRAEQLNTQQRTMQDDAAHQTEESCPLPHYSAASSSSATALASPAAASASLSSGAVCDSPDLFVQVLPSNVFRNVRLIQRAMLLTVREAKHRVLITNPYFFPPPPLFRALARAAQRGVEVMVLVPGEGKTDVPFTRWASQHIYWTLLKKGVRIFELQSSVLHAKTVTIDGIYSSIGSFNWDRLSARRNLEVNITILDPCIAQSIEGHFHTDLTHAREVTLESMASRGIVWRILHRFAYFGMRYMPFPLMALRAFFAQAKAARSVRKAAKRRRMQQAPQPNQHDE